MVRPCFLVIDREHSGSMSTRKLVIESAKFNVITAFSGAEAIETFKVFPAVDGVVVDEALSDLPCADLVRTLKEIKPGVAVVAVGSPGSTRCTEADHHLESFAPEVLVALLRRLEKGRTALIETQNRELAEAGE